MTPTLEVGDHVFIGAAGPGKVHWIITLLRIDGLADLESGMTGRRATAPVNNLTLYSKGSPA